MVDTRFFLFFIAYKSFMIMSHYTTNENVPTYSTITSPKGGGYYQENRLKDERTKKI